MKRKKLLCKSIALGLAVAMAATTMSVPGGVLNPTAVYAEDAENTQVGEVQLTLEGIQGTSGVLQGVQISADGKTGTVYYVLKSREDKFEEMTADQVIAENQTVSMENGIAQIDSTDKFDSYPGSYLYVVLQESDGTTSAVATAMVDRTSFLNNTGRIKIDSSQKNFVDYFDCDDMKICENEEELKKGVSVTFSSKDKACTQDDFDIQYEQVIVTSVDDDGTIHTNNQILPDGQKPTETGEYLIHIKSKSEEQKYYTESGYTFTNTSLHVVVKMSDPVTVKYYDKDGTETPDGLVKDGYALISAEGYKKCGAYLDSSTQSKFTEQYRYDFNEHDANMALKYNSNNQWEEAVSFFKDDNGTEFYQNVPITYAEEDNFEGNAYLDVNGIRADENTVVKEGDQLTISFETNADKSNATYGWYRDGSKIECETQNYTLTSEDVGHRITGAISNLGEKKNHWLSVQTGYVLSKDGSSVPAPAFDSLDENAHTLTFTGKEGKTYVYSLDGGDNWTEITLDSETGIIPLGNKAYKAGNIQIRAKEGTTIVSYNQDIVVPLEGTVELTGTEKYGQTITAQVTGAQEGAALQYTFIRVKDSAETVAQTSEKPTYTIGKDDIGCTLKVKVTADGYDESKPLVSAETLTVEKADGRTVETVTGYMQQVGESYTYTVTPVAGAEYRMNDGDWQKSNVFTDIKPGTQNVKFSAQIPEDDCYKAGEVKTSDPVNFAKLTREMPKLSYTVTDGEDGAKIVTIDPVEGAVYYQYDGKQIDNNVFTVPADQLEKVTIGIWLPETDIYQASRENKQMVNLTLETQTAPEAAVLTAKVNAAGTGYDITVTEPKAEEGVTYEYSNSPMDGFGTLEQLTGLTDVAPGTKVVIYVRKAAVEGKKNASPATECSIQTDLFQAAAPVISGPTSFIGTATVTMTAAGKIYYTTDGSTPTVDSTLYTGAITIDKTTTIKAIAVENGKPVSDVTSLTLTKTSSGSGSSGSGSSGSAAGADTPAVKPETKTETTTETKPDGTVVTTTTTTAEDGTQNVVVELKNVENNSSATVTVSKDASGKTLKAEAAVEQVAKKNTLSVSGTLIAQITEAAGTKNVNVVTSVKDSNGAKIGTITVNAEKLVAGKKLAVVKVNPKTGEKTLVNAKSYKVTKDGSISVSGLKNAEYELITTTEKTDLSKKIAKTVTAKNAKKTVKNGAKTTFAFGTGLNKENVKSVKYVSSKKSVAAVDKNGKIKAKKAGKTIVKAVVTLKDGTKKTVKTEITVKSK